jgi:hypothetical protein
LATARFGASLKGGYIEVMRFIRHVCVCLAILGVLLLAGAVVGGWRMVWDYHTRDSRFIGTWWNVEWVTFTTIIIVNLGEGKMDMFEVRQPGNVWHSYSELPAPCWKLCPAVRIEHARNIASMAHGWNVAWWVLFSAWETPLALLYLAAWKFDRRRRLLAEQRAAQHAFPVEPAHTPAAPPSAAGQ